MLDSLQETGRSTEKTRIELEVRNGTFDPDDEEIISKILTKLETIFGRPKMDEIMDCWDVFDNMKREEEEDIETFMLNFDTAEAGLRALDCPVDKKILSLILMKAINVDKNEKRNIVSNLKLESETIYEDLKSSIRLHKSSLVEGKKSKQKENEVMYGESKSQERFSSNFRGRAKSDSVSNRGRRFRNFNEKRFYKGSQSNNRNSSGRRNRSGSRHGSRSGSRSRASNEDWTFEEVQMIDQEDDEYYDEMSKDDDDEDGRQYEEVKAVTYKDKIDNYERTLFNLSKSLKRLIIDSAATKSVSGAKWFNNVLLLLPNEMNDNLQ